MQQPDSEPRAQSLLPAADLCSEHLAICRHLAKCQERAEQARVELQAQVDALRLELQMARAEVQSLRRLLNAS